MKKRWLSLFFLLFMLLFLPGCQAKKAAAPPGSSVQQAETQPLSVHFLDVGQGDCMFIQQGVQTMLIDAGNAKDGAAIVAFLQDQGVTRLTYLIATHPHADHIGGMAEVIQAFPVDTLLMPKVMHTSKMFERLLDAIDEKGQTITAAKAGMSFPLGNSQFTLLSPRKDSYQKLNHYSVVFQLRHGENTFLFTGDAEVVNEEEWLSQSNLHSTVLKVGHHGSSTSSSAAFLDQVRPAYAVISVGAKNPYGHPAEEVKERLLARNIQLYRTDQNGRITMVSDGKNITIETEK